MVGGKPALSLQVGGESPVAMFALAHWLLPRVPTIGEEIDVDAIGYRVKVEGVRWESRGRAVVRLQEGHVDPAILTALEADGWTVSQRGRTRLQATGSLAQTCRPESVFAPRVGGVSRRCLAKKRGG